MGWFRKKDSDPVAAYRAELDRQVAEHEATKHDDDPFFEALHRNMVIQSGGWCAPSEVIYDLPEISVRRGGVTF